MIAPRPLDVAGVSGPPVPYADPMATLSQFALLVTEDAGGHGFTRPLPMPPEAFGLIALALGLLLLLFLWFFRRTVPLEPESHPHTEHDVVDGAQRREVTSDEGRGGHH